MHFSSILDELELGTLRAARKEDGQWRAITEVKSAILAAFKEGRLTDYRNGFVDKDTLPPRGFSVDGGVRMVPGGSSVRRGAHVGKNTIIMPPSFINIGAFVDEGTMIDSHVLVGSCAQVGKRVHVSAGVQIGGVLEPIQATPVIIEDDAFIGAGAIVVEGVVILRGAVIAPGLKLSRGTPVFDCINERILDASEPIPENAVVVPGSRPVSPQRAWASRLGLNLDCALIIKYRDEKTNAALVLEDALRGATS